MCANASKDFRSKPGLICANQCLASKDLVPRSIHKILTLSSESVAKKIFIRRYFKYLQHPNSVTKGFVPDILHILCRYNLTPILNNYLAQNIIPSKYAWKKPVWATISNNELILWSNRLDNDYDFVRFKTIHKCIEPSILWTYPLTRQELDLAHSISKLWVSPPDRNPSVCAYCELIVTDMLRHITTDCPLTITLKDDFTENITNSYQTIDNINITLFDSEKFLSFLLGGCVDSSMDNDMAHDIVLLCYTYIRDCMNYYYNT